MHKKYNKNYIDHCINALKNNYINKNNEYDEFKYLKKKIDNFSGSHNKIYIEIEEKIITLSRHNSVNKQVCTIDKNNDIKCWKTLIEDNFKHCNMTKFVDMDYDVIMNILSEHTNEPELDISYKFNGKIPNLKISYYFKKLTKISIKIKKNDKIFDNIDNNIESIQILGWSHMTINKCHYLPNNLKFLILCNLIEFQGNNKIVLPNSIVALNITANNYILPYKTKYLVSNAFLINIKKTNIKYLCGDIASIQKYYDSVKKKIKYVNKLKILHVCGSDNYKNDNYDDNIFDFMNKILYNTLIFDDYHEEYFTINNFTKNVIINIGESFNSPKINVYFPDKLDYLSIGTNNSEWEHSIKNMKKNNLCFDNTLPRPMVTSGLMQIIAYGSESSREYNRQKKCPKCYFLNFPKSLDFFELSNLFDVNEIDTKIRLFYIKLLNKSNINNFTKKMKGTIDAIIINEKIDKSNKINKTKKQKLLLSRQVHNQCCLITKLVNQNSFI